MGSGLFWNYWMETPSVYYNPLGNCFGGCARVLGSVPAMLSSARLIWRPGWWSPTQNRIQKTLESISSKVKKQMRVEENTASFEDLEYRRKSFGGCSWMTMATRFICLGLALGVLAAWNSDKYPMSLTCWWQWNLSCLICFPSHGLF